MARPKDLTGLQNAINDGLDEAHDGPGDEVTEETKIRASGNDDGAGEDKETPSPSTGDEDADGKETPSPEGDEDETQDEESKDAKTDDDEPAADPLEGVSESKKKALLKFAKGGKISNADELRAAEDALIDDYWRNHTRLADVAAREKEASTATDDKQASDKEPGKESPPKPAEIPPELKPYEDDIQAIVSRASSADENKKGWETERSKLTDEIESYEARLARGDAEVSESGLNTLYRKMHKAEEQIRRWSREWDTCNKEFGKAQVRKRDAATLHELRQREDRREKDAQAKEQRDKQAERDRTVDAAAAVGVTEAKIPDTEKERFGKYLRFEISEHFRQGNQKIEDLNAFAKRAAENFMGPVRAASQKAAEQYNKDKRADAPTPPTNKKKAQPGNGSAKSSSGKKSNSPASMSELEALVQGSNAWNG